MTKQNKPGWVTAVAIIAIVLSGFGAMGGLQEAGAPNFSIMDLCNDCQQNG